MQLTLDIELPEEATLDNFCWHGNELLESQVKYHLASKAERFFYIWGKPASGKSHLLQAISSTLQHNASYLPLKQLKTYGPDALMGIEALSLICLDDIDAVSGDKAFEEALFHLYNKCRDKPDTLLFISGQQSATQLDIVLPDLRSRLSWGLNFELHSLSEEDKKNVLISRAKQKGLSLNAQVSDYLLTHYSRDMHDINGILHALDKASLEKQRKLTIPFVKEVLART